jgi:hypothetical protein
LTNFLLQVFLFSTIFFEMHGLGFSCSLDSPAFGGGPWSPSFHFSLSTYILSMTYASVMGCYHYSKVDLSTLVELTLPWIPSPPPLELMWLSGRPMLLVAEVRGSIPAKHRGWSRR